MEALEETINNDMEDTEKFYSGERQKINAKQVLILAIEHTRKLTIPIYTTTFPKLFQHCWTKFLAPPKKVKNRETHNR